MIARVIVRPAAEADLQEAYAWYEERESGLGAEFVRCVDSCVENIVRHPEMYPTVHQCPARCGPALSILRYVFGRGGRRNCCGGLSRRARSKRVETARMIYRWQRGHHAVVRPPIVARRNGVRCSGQIPSFFQR
jgi:plasmid stabilization system protein ParE